MLLGLGLCACEGQEYGQVVQHRELDSFAYVDAGAVALGQRKVVNIPLFSRGNAGVDVVGFAVEDVLLPEGAAAPAFSVDPASWTDPACDMDGDGTADCRGLGAYDDHSEADTVEVKVTFAPTVEGYYEALATIWSNDNRSLETSTLPGDGGGTEYSVWRVQVRGVSRPACGRAWPRHIDFGYTPAAGGDFPTTISVQNCGIVPLEITSFQLDGTVSMASTTLFPLYVLAGETEVVDVSWHVAAQTGGEPTPEGATGRFVSNSASLDGAPVTIIGNDCSQSADPGWDRDGDGWFSCGGDCDDSQPSVSPSAYESVDDGRDNDCDGVIDEEPNREATDDDGDGCNETGSSCGGGHDCDDADPAVSPNAVEVANQVDDDCNGLVDDQTDAYDDDGDSYSERAGDCDDTNPYVFPGAPEPIDGVDNNCDGRVDEGGSDVDDDGDGYPDVGTNPALDDCDDLDPWVFAGAREYCDDYDNDCDGLVDEGPDDEELGACAFRPSRAAEDTGIDAGGGCRSAPRSGSVPVLLAIAAVTRMLVRRAHGD
jgi:hypothetical protein